MIRELITFSLFLTLAIFCLQCTAQEAFVPDANMDRAEVPELYKWKLDAMFESDQAWEEAIVKVQAGQAMLKDYEGRLGDARTLYECLKAYFDLHVITNRITLYANLKHTVDQVSPENQVLLDRGLQVMDGLMNAARFIRGEIMGMPDQSLDAAFASVPDLAEFKPYIDDFRRRKRILQSEESEKILALAGDNLFAEIDLNEIPAPPEKAFGGIMSDIPWPEIVDEDGKKVTLSLSSYGRYRGSKDRKVRAAAVEEFFKTLKQYRHVLAACLAGQVSFNSFLARARGYDGAMEAYLDKDEIPAAVVDNLIDTINNNLGPLHKYMALRKKIMGVDELRLYDLYVPMVAGVDKEIPFETARKQIIEALEPLGQDYQKLLTHGLDPSNGWIDLYPHKNKDSGASSSSTYGCHPYVKMNYLNTMDDASTLAHEFGHALHSYLAMKTQSPASHKYVSFIAEVASTSNEVLLSEYQAAIAADKKEKLYILNGLAESIRTTIYRQTLFAEFEKTIHSLYESGRTLTSELMCKTYRELVERYYGSDYTLGENDDIEWAYIPHFYWKFYVYNYATGLSAGIALAGKVKEGGAPARDRYLEMLKGGCSLPPVELLKRAGVDMTKPDSIKAAADLLDRTLDEMAALID